MESTTTFLSFAGKKAVFFLLLVLVLNSLSYFLLPEVIVEATKMLKVTDQRYGWEGVVGLIVITGPFLETLFMQVLPIELGRLPFKNQTLGYWIGGVLSTAIFGGMHYYNPGYIFIAACMGAFLAWTYIDTQRQFDGWRAAFLVLALHMANNLGGVLLWYAF